MSVSDHPDHVAFEFNGSIVSGTVVEPFEKPNVDVTERERGYVVAVDGVDSRYLVPHDDVITADE